MATTQAVLEVEQGADPIRGWLVDESGRRTPFYGWLELARLVGSLAAGESEVAGDGPAPASPQPEGPSL